MIFRFLLFLLLAGLAGGFWWYNYSEKANKPLQTLLVELEREKVDAVEIQLPEKAAFLLKKTADTWVGTQGNASFRVKEEVVDSLLIPISNIQTERMLGDEEKADVKTKPIKVAYFQKGALLEAFELRRIRDEKGWYTLFRFSDRPELYKLSADIWPFFDQPVKEYRYFEFVDLKPESVLELGLSPQPQAVFSLQKDSTGWHSKDIPAAWIPAWLERLQGLQGEEHADYFDPVAGSGLLSFSVDLRLEGEEEPLRIFVYRDTLGASEFILHCSQYPDHFFQSDSSGLYQLIVPEIFRDSSLILE
ncbi:MAG: hypothetical protein GYB31_18940 [Bacteroidetes bacterium]|nr:hypothetical protein [Bacteroidota bacterium]